METQSVSPENALIAAAGTANGTIIDVILLGRAGIFAGGQSESRNGRGRSPQPPDGVDRHFPLAAGIDLRCPQVGVITCWASGPIGITRGVAVSRQDSL